MCREAGGSRTLRGAVLGMAGFSLLQKPSTSWGYVQSHVGCVIRLQPAEFSLVSKSRSRTEQKGAHPATRLCRKEEKCPAAVVPRQALCGLGLGPSLTPQHRRRRECTGQDCLSFPFPFLAFKLRWNSQDIKITILKCTIQKKNQIKKIKCTIQWFFRTFTKLCTSHSFLPRPLATTVLLPGSVRLTGSVLTEMGSCTM